MLRVRPEGGGERLRQHPEHAHAAHQVAVLKGARVIRGKVVDVRQRARLGEHLEFESACVEQRAETG